MTRADVDVHDPDLWAAGVPHDLLRRLRREAPVFRQELTGGRGYWALTRYADVVAVSRDPGTFSSALGGTQIEDPTPAQRPLVDGMLLNLDPPRHGTVRRLVMHAFTPRMVARLEPWVRTLARGVLEDARARGAVDLVADVAAVLPLQVIAELMGVPAEDRPLLRDWSERLVGFDDPELGRAWDDALGSATAMAAYGWALAERRRGTGGQDLVSALIDAVVDGARLDAVELGSLFVQLAVAGNETTRTLLAGAVLALAAHPDEHARLAADRGLVPRAVEECLRWVTPLHYFRRTAVRDCVIRGQSIRAGDRVVMLYASANRDEEVFPDPDRFDVGRDPNPHLAFGIGEHFCAGAALARLETRVFLEEWLALGLEAELAGPVRRLRSNLVNGIKAAPIRLRTRR